MMEANFEGCAGDDLTCRRAGDFIALLGNVAVFASCPGDVIALLRKVATFDT